MGSDEVGTGDYFGPVCVCAAYVKAEDIKWLTELGINDSKKLSDEKIKEIVPQIIKRVTYASLTLENTKYNELVAKGFNQGMIKAYLHNKAFNALRAKVGDTKCLTVLDQFVNEKAYYNYLKNEKNLATNIHFETKAETYYPAVAVGSIIARYSFITKMAKLSRELGIDIPMGASTMVDKTAAEVIKKYGEEKLNEVAKVHFQNTKRAKAIN
jgi:ribonuclease HIII